MQFKQLADQYMEERANYKHSTLKGYRSILSAHLLPTFGGKEAEEITASDIRMFQVKLTEAGLAGSRINTICQLLRCILHEAYRENVIQLDPTKGVRKVRQSRAKVEPFTQEEIEKIFNYVDPHYLPLFQTLLLTGMRPNEAFALTWADINFEAKTINIDKGMVGGVEDTTKTESSERVIPMVDTLVAILLPLRKEAGKVFLTKAGGEMKFDLDRIWKRAVIKAGVSYRPPYNLRHSWASKALTAGIPVAYISKILGHSNIGTTLKYYARWIDSKEQENNFRALMG
jgi:integrase